MSAHKNIPLISVIIPCYNHGHFLPQAIESVYRQTYQNFEIIVIDDGSTDDTKEQASLYPSVHYFFQKNAGLSAARNKGIDVSSGEYLVFLDADDYLYPKALEINSDYLKRLQECAFVSGGHDKVDQVGNLKEDCVSEVVEGNHYEKLLRGNYIGMHATVMYQRWAFNNLRFDTSLEACEDYDLYLKLARHYPIGCHSHKIAAYRFHSQNMSSNIPWMLKSVLHVLERQRPLLRNAQEHVAFGSGNKIWKEYYSTLLFGELSASIGKNNSWPTKESLEVLVKEKPGTILPYFLKKSRAVGKQWIKSKLHLNAKHGLDKNISDPETIPALGKIVAGDFGRVTPFSTDFGFDRGGAIDRYYIERFLENNSMLIKGRVLEIGDNEYTLKFGNKIFMQSEILHVHDSNPKATIVGDLTDLPHVANDSFDCIILTQTLHLIYDFKSALRTCHRILKPGGVLLMTVPGITPVDKGEWKDAWLWSFTSTAINKILKETFSYESADVHTCGNVYVASSFLYGVGLPELPKQFLDIVDESFPVIISAKVVKQRSHAS